MEKTFLKTFSLIFLLVLVSCNFSPNDSEKLEKMKSLVKETLIDGESAQFSELKYYKLTNHGCGNVNAKNKLGGYVGKKKFIVSLDQNLVTIDSDREIPEAPTKPSIASDYSANASIRATINYALESAKWAAIVEEKRNLHMAFDAAVAEKCTDTPPKQDKKEADKKELPENKIQFIPYEEKDGFIVQYSNEYPLYAINLAKALEPDLIKVLQPKGSTETSTEFANRSNYHSLESTTVDLSSDYGLVLMSDYLFNESEGFQVEYNADTEMATIQSSRESCTDPARDTTRNPAIADSMKAIFGSSREPIVKGREYGITCNANSITRITFSSKQVDFLKYFKYQEGFQQYAQLKDSFKLSKQKLLELPTPSYSNNVFYVGIMIVGRVNKNLTISNFKDETENFYPGGTPSIPFTVKKIVYYNNKNGEILASRDLK